MVGFGLSSSVPMIGVNAATDIGGLKAGRLDLLSTGETIDEVGESWKEVVDD